MANLLQIKNLHAIVEEKEILKGIDLEVNKGEIHAIMGEWFGQEYIIVGACR